MLTQGTTPDILSSMLLAIWRLHPSKAQKVLPHLVNPSPPDDYQYLDGFATLCSLVPQCESASAAVETGADSVNLYIVISPSTPPPLRNAMATWIRLMQQMPTITSASDSGAVVHIDKCTDSLFNAGPVGNFVADVYRICHKKLFVAIEYCDEAKCLLEEVSSTPDKQLSFLGLNVQERPLLVDSLKVLTGIIGYDLAESSVQDLLRLHGAVRTAGKYKDHFPDVDFLPIADRLSEAVDFLVGFFTLKDNQKKLKLLQDIHSIDVTGPRDITATINSTEFLKYPPGHKQSRKEIPYGATICPKCMSEVEGSPGHFKATGVMHSESALIQHVLDNNLSIDPYIGTSHSACYPCLMLVRACNSVFENRKFALGRRHCIIDDTITTWMWPNQMNLQVYHKLVSNLRSDFEAVCDKVRYDNARMMPIVNDTSLLSESGQKAAGL